MAALSLSLNVALAFTAWPRVVDGVPSISRRAALSSVVLSQPAAVGTQPAMPSAGKESEVSWRGAPAEHASFEVEVGGERVPVAAWWPRDAAPPIAGIAPTTSPSYDYRIDLGRIANKMRVSWLQWLPASEFALPRGVGDAPKESLARSAEPLAIVFAHGFLGSRYDQAHES